MVEEVRHRPEVVVEVGGEVTGQIAIGDNIVQIRADHGAVVNVAPPEQRVVPRLRRAVRLLPRDFHGLLGREAEVEAAVSALDRNEPLQFHAGEGWGKTVLLRRVAHQEAALRSPRVAHLSAAGRPVQDLLQQLFEVFYETERPYRPPDGELRRLLQDVVGVVLLDDGPSSREDLQLLLDAAPRVSFVLAGEERSLWGEGVAVPLRGLDDDQAVALFSRELGAEIEPRQRPAALRLCSTLQGQPLRILQAAAAVRESGAPLDAVVERLSAGPEDALADAQESTLSPSQRDVLALLTGLAGAPVPAADVARFAGVQDSARRLEELERRWLVRREGARYRSAASQALAARLAPEAERQLDRATDFYLTSAATAEGRENLLLSAAEAIARLVDRAAERRDWDVVRRLALGLERAAALGRRWRTWETTAARLIEAGQALGDRATEAYGRHQLGTVRLCRGDRAAARRELRRALTQRRSLGDRGGAAVTRHNLALARRWRVPPWWRTAAVAGLGIAILGAVWNVAVGGGGVTASTASLRFSEQQVGTASAAKPVTLRHEGRGAVTIAEVRLAGAHPLDFRVGGGCEGATLRRGESCDVVVRFRPVAEGERTARLVVSWGSGKGTAVSLAGTGVAPRVRVVPDTLRFGPLPAGTPSSRRAVLVRNTGSAELSVTRVGVVPEGAPFRWDASACLAAAVAPGDACRIRVTFEAAEPGSWTGNLAVWNTASRRPSLVALRGFATLPRVRVAPSALRFESVEGEASPRRPVTIRNTGGVPVRLQSVGLAGPEAAHFGLDSDCPGELAPEGSCEVRVWFHPRGPGERRAALLIAPERGPPVEVTLVGLALESPLAAIPRSLDFGIVRLGYRSASQTATIRNEREGDVQVVGATASPDTGDFRVSDGCRDAVLAPGATCTLRVVFSPQGTGRRDATLTVHHDAPGPPVTVALSGFGGSAGPDIDVSPTAVDFGEIDYHDQYDDPPEETATVTVRNVGDGDLTILDVDIVDGEGFEVRSESCTSAPVRPDRVCTVVVEFVGELGEDGEDAEYKADLRIRHDAPEEDVRVALSGQVDGPS